MSQYSTLFIGEMSMTFGVTGEIMQLRTQWSKHLPDLRRGKFLSMLVIVKHVDGVSSIVTYKSLWIVKAVQSLVHVSTIIGLSQRSLK